MATLYPTLPLFTHSTFCTRPFNRTRSLGRSNFYHILFCFFDAQEGGFFVCKSTLWCSRAFRPFVSIHPGPPTPLHACKKMKRKNQRIILLPLPAQLHKVGPYLLLSHRVADVKHNSHTLPPRPYQKAQGCTSRPRTPAWCVVLLAFMDAGCFMFAAVSGSNDLWGSQGSTITAPADGGDTGAKSGNGCEP